MQLVVLAPSVLAAAPLPPFLYDELAIGGHPVLTRLRDTQRVRMQALWHRCNKPDGHVLRRGLPGDRHWFARAFCGGADLAAAVEEDRNIFPYVCEYTLLEPLALLACHPATLEAFYDPALVRPALGVEHMVIGGATTGSSAGVRDCAKLRSFMLDGCRHALAISMAHATSLSSQMRAEEAGRKLGLAGLSALARN